MSEDPDAHALSPSWRNRLLLATIIKDWLVKRPDNIAQHARNLSKWLLFSERSSPTTTEPATSVFSGS
uniref:WGS project CBMF000000000 data, contig CS5834_c000338 n=1 Tax=Fusarium pseudograminearum CS5834 TaxID=1318459 RepID=A0A096PE04_FUSPS|nr:unnamed protein product [Fusarium pseudograminearum CS5834]